MNQRSTTLRTDEELAVLRQRVKTFRPPTELVEPIFSITDSRDNLNAILAMHGRLPDGTGFEGNSVEDVIYFRPKISGVTDPVVTYALMYRAFKEAGYSTVPSMGVNIGPANLSEVLTLPRRALGYAVQSERFSGDHQIHVLGDDKHSTVSTSMKAARILCDASHSGNAGSLPVPYGQAKFEIVGTSNGVELGKARGLEILMRLEHDDLPIVVTPYHFGAAADSLGVMQSLDDSTREKAFQFASELHKEMIYLPIAINVSGDELAYKDKPEDTPGVYFRDIITQLLTKYNLPADYIRVELTEVPRNATNVELNSAIAELNSIGVEVDLDDCLQGVNDQHAIDELDVAYLKFDPAAYGSSKPEEFHVDPNPKKRESVFRLIQTHRRKRNSREERSAGAVSERLGDLTVCASMGITHVQAFDFYRPASSVQIVNDITSGNLQVWRYAA